jgi:hypothetical protein
MVHKTRNLTDLSSSFVDDFLTSRSTRKTGLVKCCHSLEASEAGGWVLEKFGYALEYLSIVCVEVEIVERDIDVVVQKIKLDVTGRWLA